MDREPTRRGWLRATLGAASLGVVAGCTGDDDTASEEPQGESDGDGDGNADGDGGDEPPEGTAEGEGDGTGDGSDSEEGSESADSARNVSGAGTWRQAAFDARQRGFTPDYRGPTESLAEHWSLDAPKASRPVASDGTAYVVDRTGVTHAIDVGTGDVQWTHESDVGVDTERPAAPVVGEDAIYSGTDGRIHALDPADGSVLWTTEGTAESPEAVLADGDRLYVRGDQLSAVDTGSGERLWNRDLSGDAPTDPKSIAVADGSLVAIAGPSVFDGEPAVVLSLAGGTGDIEWERQIEAIAGNGNYDAGEIAVDAGLIFVPGEWTNEIRALDAANGETVWTAETPEAFGSPAVADGTLYTATADPGRTMRANDAETGEALSEWNPGASFLHDGRPSVTDDVLYAFGLPDWYQNGVLVGMDAETGEVLLEHSLDTSLVQGPTVVEDAIIVSNHDQNRVAAYAPEPGTE